MRNITGLSFFCDSVLYFPSFLQIITNYILEKGICKIGYIILGKNRQNYVENYEQKQTLEKASHNFTDVNF